MRFIAAPYDRKRPNGAVILSPNAHLRPLENAGQVGVLCLFRGACIPFTREGSQVQSLPRPPFKIKHLGPVVQRVRSVLAPNRSFGPGG